MDIKASSNYSTLLINDYTVYLEYLKDQDETAFSCVDCVFATCQGFVGNLILRHEISDSDAPKELKKLV